MWSVLSEQQILCAPLGSGVCRDLQDCAEHFCPKGALAQAHVSVTLHFILYTGKLKVDVAWCLLTSVLHKLGCEACPLAQQQQWK